MEEKTDNSVSNFVIVDASLPGNFLTRPAADQIRIFSELISRNDVTQVLLPDQLLSVGLVQQNLFIAAAAISPQHSNEFRNVFENWIIRTNSVNFSLFCERCLVIDNMRWAVRCYGNKRQKPYILCKRCRSDWYYPCSDDDCSNQVHKNPKNGGWFVRTVSKAILDQNFWSEKFPFCGPCMAEVDTESFQQIQCNLEDDHECIWFRDWAVRFSRTACNMGCYDSTRRPLGRYQCSNCGVNTNYAVKIKFTTVCEVCALNVFKLQKVPEKQSLKRSKSQNDLSKFI